MINPSAKFFLNENQGVFLGARVFIRQGSSEWFDAIDKKFVHGQVGIVDCIGRWSGLIQVRFPSRLVYGFSPENLCLAVNEG